MNKLYLKFLIVILVILNFIFSNFLIIKYNINNINNKYLIISYIIQIILILSIHLNLYKLTYLYHCLFAYMSLITIILSDNIIVLLYSLMLILTITFIRRIFNHCIIRQFENKDINKDYLYKRNPYIWDYINYTFGMIAFIKILYYYKSK